ncbi:MAG: ribbon-helix-helix domain-containing protein [Firmicutes bacterium]|nr:ribbon-helix-helix protein, CopG family [Alicyclobacillaceae bacterium]MCL6498163.1 ribbon-helix-helix domain-containing protein [Bacillota bacterium]
MADYYGRPRTKAYVAFQVRLSPELKEKLVRRAFATGKSQVAIVKEALEQYFDHLAREHPEERARIEEGLDKEDD